MIKLESTNIKDSSFEDVNLENTGFDNVNLKNATFKNINMEGVVFDDVYFGNPEIVGSNLDGFKVNGILISELLALYDTIRK